MSTILPDELEALAPDLPESESSLGRDSTFRLLVDVVGLVLATVGAVITARWLGPSGKGITAALAFLGGLVGRASSLGVGESAIVFVGQRRVAMGVALRANLAVVLASGFIGLLVCGVVACLLIGPDSANLWLAIAATSLAVPLAGLFDVLGRALTMRHEINRSSVVVLIIAVATVVLLCIFVIALSLDVLGAALAGMVALAIGTASSFALLPSDLRVGPRWNRPYLRLAIPYGLRLEVSYMVGLMTGRLDLLLVYALAGAAAAGNYSVALTVGALVGMAPFALSYAAFPRLAYAEPDVANELALRMYRGAMILSVVSGAALAAVSPLLIPALFGDDFSPAVAPTILLLAATVLAGGQSLLSRAAAAQADPRLLLSSYGASLAVMLVLDLLLIPRFDLIGAAIASICGSAVGLGLCWRRFAQRGVPLRSFCPGREDLVDLIAQLGDVMRATATRIRPPRSP